uniref:Lophotrochin n=1 Tax=Phoronopsis harmeri TaxID=490051 RepID=A0A6M3Z674_9BILA|nr:lophotrochin [Phoronopsis harmeri]
MTKESMMTNSFETLMARINQETGSPEQKIEILFSSKGSFNAEQATRVMYAYASPSHKVRAIQIMEPRLIRMSCSEARSILGAVSVHNDKLIVLDCMKRALTDCQMRLGQEFILSAFPYEDDKMRALSILGTVRSDVADKTPAGGHQGYAALGGLYTQARPMVPHLYGSIPEQRKTIPGYGAIEIPPEAQPGVVPSMYTGHPSYAYPRDRSFAQDRGYPGTEGYPATIKEAPTYPAGAPPVEFTGCGAPAPTGFPGLEKYTIQY